MIPFIWPYWDEDEIEVYKGREQRRFTATERYELIERVKKYFPEGDCVIAPSGREIIRFLCEMKSRKSRKLSASVPDVICGTVYEAVRSYAKMYLMDADETWNCVYDERSKQSDILLFASLGGKRKGAPSRTIGQTVIDDAAQCYDGVSGLRGEFTDYSVFSFSKGKQMCADGGGVLWSAIHNLSEAYKKYKEAVPTWQICLMATQLEKIEKINENRRRNGLYLLEQLRGVSWLRLPYPDDNMFTKFTVFIRQSERKPFLRGEMNRTPEIFRFMQHMRGREIQVEETYIPLHQRFPETFPEEMYDEYWCDHAWTEAIVLPCRPNLTEQELEQIANAVRRYEPVDRGVQPWKVWDEQHSAENIAPSEGYFQKLSGLRMDMIRMYGKGKVLLDLGCGPGVMMRQLLKEGFDVHGVDFSESLLEEGRQLADREGVEWKVKVQDITDMKEVKSEKFDLVYSASTFYYIQDLRSALGETNRVLKDGGFALIDFGNEDSLNTIEVEGQETVSYHVKLSDLWQMLRECGFEVLQRRCFQLFPLHGRYAFLRQMFKAEVDGRMLDELVSSAPLLRDYAFRQLLLLRKTKDPELFAQDDKTNAFAWATEGRREKRSVANASGSPQLYSEMLHEDPADVLTALDMMTRLSNAQNHAFINRVRQEVTVKMKDQLPNATVDVSGPKVSVVLPTYNQFTTLVWAVDSVLKQTLKDFELIIINDASTDQTADFTYTLGDKRVQVIRHEENKKLPAALNTGFAAARGEYLTWVSSDCYCAPYFLEALVRALDKNLKAGFAYADFFLIDAKGRMFSRITNPDYGRRSLLVRNDGNAAFMYRRECMDAVGEYDTELEGAEDWDYWIRISELFDFVYVPEALYYYMIHGGSMQSTKAQLVNESILKMLEKTYKRHGGEVALDVIYPHLRESSDVAKNTGLAAWYFAETLRTRGRARMDDLVNALMAKAYSCYPQLKGTEQTLNPEEFDFIKKERENRIVYEFSKVV